MTILYLALAGVMAQAITAGAMAVGQQQHSTCATQDASLEKQGLWTQEEDNGREIQLGAAFHFCCVSEADCPSDNVAREEIGLMNEFYAPAQIRFRLDNTTRIIDAGCGQTDVTDQATMDRLKARSHQGSVATLNMVYVPTNQGPGAKGYCVIPPPSGNIDQIFGRQDGCVVATSTLPGQAQHGDGRDVTSVHEAGHWLGLQHWNEGALSRRQRGGTRNIMVPWQITGQGIEYQFHQSQIPSLRQMAMRRKSQGAGGQDTAEAVIAGN